MADVHPYQYGGVTGFIHSPIRSGDRGSLVLTHGAGANCESLLLVSVATALADLGLCVLRCNLRFREKKQFGPPSRGQDKGDREGLLEAVEQMSRSGKGPIFLGGHSYGGRQASILASEQKDVAAGLLLLSYPLHPPAKPKELRTGHFRQINTPCLFVYGSGDPFASEEELQTALKLIPARTKLVEIQNAGHDLAKENGSVATLVATEFCEFASARQR